ncbi:hypothetical protein, partial [Nocardioides sp.]|uniref:hypothetical protein n=1 Tax=Nocardioides sp. TaxID=35761 RepID=UPI00356AA8A5
FAGTGAAATDSMRTYGADAVTDALIGDVWFILCWSPLLALITLWAGQNYRTQSTRRLAAPLAVTALGAGALDLLENASLQLAVAGFDFVGIDPQPRGWEFGATFAWGKWLVVLLVGAFALGGIVSLATPRRIRRVLRAADEARPPAASRTLDESDFGLAFSGGGIRAASISLGALQALEYDEPLGWDTADNVASVSGGSYMAGAWSLARTAPAADPNAPPPRPWALGRVQPGPEERHLRANLGYLLSNTPRGIGDAATEESRDHQLAAKAKRRPSAIATVLTGMTINALVMLMMLWAVSQPMGWFYRWYLSLGCTQEWQSDATLTAAKSAGCLGSPDRLAPPILFWAVLGLAVLMLWVLAAKLTETSSNGIPPAWLLGLKYLGYAGLALSATLLFTLGVLPVLIRLLWTPVDTNDLLTSLVAAAGALGSAAAVGRVLRKPLARFAPTIGGLLFATLLLFLACRFALDAMRTGPGDGEWIPWSIVVAVLLALHVVGATEFWSLAAFYRGKLRAAFATYRDGGRVRAYDNNSKPSPGSRIEPDLSTLVKHRTPGDHGTPLTVCAAATVSGRDVRTHYGIPALSMTFSPSAVRLFVPMEENGLWRRYECTAEQMGSLMPTWGPRLTTMMAVGLSGAAVSPAMGRFKAGPVSMLLAFANVRLGMWVPNPRYAAELAQHGKRLPRPGLGYLLKEFLGFHDHSDLFLYVTDGGHWENTALVELLRTSHHREIVCIDADSGPGNLAGSISKAIDLAALECSAEVAIRLDVLRCEADPSPGRDYSPRSVNLGLVRREDGNEERISLLWYAKPALTEDMPPTLLAYREVDPSFPRVNTVNQFFHVAQFSAYRDLGRFNATQILAARRTLTDAVAAATCYVDYCAALPDDSDWAPVELAALIDQLAADLPTAEQPAYAEELYAEVRATLTRSLVDA